MMRTLCLFVAGVTLLGMPVAGTGCALFQTDSETDQTVVADAAFYKLTARYNTLLGILLDARLHGQISQQDWEDDFLPWINRGDSLLTQMDIARTQDLDQFETLRLVLLEALTQMER